MERPDIMEPLRKRRKNLSNHLCCLVDNKYDDGSILKFHELIAEGADVNYQNPQEEGNTPLHLAIYEKNAEWVQLLLENGATTTIKNGTGKTPADLAKETGSDKIVQLLSRKFKSVDKKFVYEIDYAKFESSCEDVSVSCRKSRFKILSITKCSTLQQAFDLVIHPNFNKLFNQFAFLFVIVLNIDQDEIDFGVINDKYWQRLNGTLANEVILQISSRDSSSLFFKDRSESFQRLTMSDQIPDDIKSFTDFCNLLLLKPERFGHFESDIFKIQISTEQSFKKFRLIDYAVYFKDILTLRFLQLFGPIDLEYTNEGGSLLLTTIASAEVFKILLEIPESDENLQSLLLPENRRVLNLKVEGLSLSMLAAAKGNFDVVNFLIDCGLDLNQEHYDQEYKTVSDFAWEAEKFDVLIKIVTADGPFPRSFNPQADPELKTLIEERNEFHKYLRSNKFNDPSLHSEISRFLTRNPNLKICYNSRNRCALSTALQARQFGVYAFLRSKGFRRGLDKDDSIYAKLNIEEKDALLKANQKFFRTNGYKHIMELVSKSRVGFDSGDEKIKTIQRWYEKLDENEMLQMIMKVVANAEEIEIVLDFEKGTICDLDFKGDTTETFGRTYHKLDLIFIGAKQKQEAEVLATIAHEFTHYALKLVYKNNCRPYYANDFERSESYKGILNRYLDRNVKTIHPLIQNAFLGQKLDTQIRELVVRPPHLIALHLDNLKVLENIRAENLELFEYFERVVISDFNKVFPVMKEECKIKDLNRMFGVFTEFEHSKVTCVNFDSSFKVVDKEKKNIFIQSQVPGLCLSNLIQILKRDHKGEVDASFIFIKFNQLKDPKRTEKFQEVFHSDSTRLIVISEDLVEPQDAENAFICFKSKVVFIANLDLSSCRDIFPVQIERNYKWADLTVESKKHVLGQKISFQGQEIELNEIINNNEEILSQLSLEEILKFHEVNIESLEKFFPKELDGFIERNFENSKKIAFSQEEVCKLIEEGKSVLIANDAGVGKTMSAINFSREVKKRNPIFWVSYIDLKSYTSSFSKDEETKQIEIDHSYISGKLLNLPGNRERTLLEHLYKTKQALFVLDGFDEISPKYKIFVLEIFKALQSSGNRMLISTRVHLTEAIQQKIRVEVIKLTPFTEKNQIDFLVNFWENRNPKRKEIDFENIARSLLTAYEKSLFGRSSRDNFLGIPLQVKMLAEIHEGLEQVEIGKIHSNFNLFSLYDQFVEKKLSIWTDKGPLAKEDNNTIIKNYQNIVLMHQRSALEYFFDEEIVRDSKLPECSELFDNIKEVLARTGMLQVFEDSSPKFVHQTIAEYFVVDFMFSNPNASNQIYVRVLRDDQFRQVRKFINDKTKVVNRKQIENFSQKIIDFLNSYKVRNFLFFSLREKHLNFIEFIFMKLNLDKKPKLELLKVKRSMIFKNVIVKYVNVVQYALFRDLEVFNILWKWVKCFCDVEEKKQILRIEDENILNFALEVHKLRSIENIEAVLKIEFEVLTQKEFKEIFKPNDRFDAFDFLDPNKHFDSMKSDIFETIWKFVDKLSEEDQKEILSTKHERNLLFWANWCEDREVSELILNKFEKHLEISEKQEVVNFTNDFGNVFRYAVSCGSFVIFCKVCDLGREKFDGDNKRMEEILMAKDKNNETILMKSARKSIQIVEKLLEIAAEVISAQNMRDLLSATNKENENVLHKAAELKNVDIFKMFWNFMRKYFEDKQLKAIVHTKNKSDKNVINKAKHTHVEVYIAVGCLEEIFALDQLNCLLEHGRGKSLINLVFGDPNKIQKDKLLEILKEEIDDRLVVHDIFVTFSIEFVSRLLKILEIKLKSEELLELFSQRDSYGNNALDNTTLNEDGEVCENLWKFIITKLKPLDIKTRILTKTSNERSIFVHEALKKKVKNVLFSFLDCHEKHFSKEELLKVYQERDSSWGRTLFHFVAEFCDHESTQKFFDFSQKVFTRDLIRDLLLDKNWTNRNTLWSSLINENILSFECFFENTQKYLNCDEIEHLIFEPNDDEEFSFNYAGSRKKENVDKLRKIIVKLFGEQKLLSFI